MNRYSLLTYQGTTQSVTEWALDYGIPPATIIKRLKDGWPVGWSIEDTLTTLAGKQGQRPGVALNFGASQGTGGGRSAQETPNITFSEREAS